MQIAHSWYQQTIAEVNDCSTLAAQRCQIRGYANNMAVCANGYIAILNNFKAMTLLGIENVGLVNGVASVCHKQ